MCVYTTPIYRQKVLYHELPTYEKENGGLLAIPCGMSPALKGQVAGIEPRIKGCRNRTDDNAVTQPFLH